LQKDYLMRRSIFSQYEILNSDMRNVFLKSLILNEK